MYKDKLMEFYSSVIKETKLNKSDHHKLRPSSRRENAQAQIQISNS